MTSSHHGPYVRATHVLQREVQSAANPRGGAIPKTDLIRIAVCNSTA